MAPTTQDDYAHGIRKLVDTIAKNEGFKKFDVTFKKATKGEMTPNIMGALYLVEVQEEGRDTLHLFIKAANTPQHLREKIKTNQMYKREVHMYTTIADAFHKLQDHHKVPAEKQFKFPKYYGSCLIDSDEAIVLENMIAHGYQHLDRAKQSTEYMDACVKEIAKFHALSFALKKENPKLFKEIISNSKELDIEGCTGMIDDMGKMVPQRLALIDPENREKVEKYFQNNKGKTFTNQHKPISDYSVLVHSNYRMDKTMVKNQGSSNAEFKIFDYQNVFYGCPLIDLIHFMFISTDSESRKTQREHIIEHYYRSLADHLNLLSCDIADIYPRLKFNRELAEKMMYGLEVALFHLSVHLAENKETLKLEDLVGRMAPSNKAYEDRLNGIVRDFVSWGLLD